MHVYVANFQVSVYEKAKRVDVDGECISVQISSYYKSCIMFFQTSKCMKSYIVMNVLLQLERQTIC